MSKRIIKIYCLVEVIGIQIYFHLCVCDESRPERPENTARSLILCVLTLYKKIKRNEADAKIQLKVVSSGKLHDIAGESN